MLHYRIGLIFTASVHFDAFELLGVPYQPTVVSRITCVNWGAIVELSHFLPRNGGKVSCKIVTLYLAFLHFILQQAVADPAFWKGKGASA